MENRLTMLRLTPLFVVLASAAFAQQPEDEWNSLPAAPPVAPEPSRGPLPMPPTVPMPPVTPQPARPTLEELRAKLRARESANQVSMYGAPTLGQWNRGQALVMGFPSSQLRLAIGLLGALDVGIVYETALFMSHELRGFAKLGFGKGSGISFAVIAEAGGAWFGRRASREVNGARWMTGRRNYNFLPGVVLSYQASSLRAARLFFEGRYVLTIDTEPFSTTPLEGVPSSVIIGHNVVVRLGAELPLTERTAFTFSFGLDGHLRSVDSATMPFLAVGVVTGF